MTQNIYLIILL